MRGAGAFTIFLICSSSAAGKGGPADMGKALPVELRVRVMAALAEGMTRAEAARLFRVGEGTIAGWRRLERERGHLRPKTGTGRTRSWRIEAERDRIFGLLEADPDMPVNALCAALCEHGLSFSHSAMKRFLRRHGVRRRIGRPPGRRSRASTAPGAATLHRP